MTSASIGPRAFTLFEVLIALAVFVLAALGIARAISETVDAAMSARARSSGREMLESRLAYCQAIPPRLGETRKSEFANWRVEETLRPFEARNSEGTQVRGLYELTITAKAGKPADEEKIVVLIHKADEDRGVNP